MEPRPGCVMKMLPKTTGVRCALHAFAFPAVGEKRWSVKRNLAFLFVRT